MINHAIYFGLKRYFEERVVNNNKPNQKSHICKYCNENSYRYARLKSFEIVGRNYGNRVNRKIGEALFINEHY